MKDELNRLKKIVDKDPKSTMFVPLADEYRKQGLLEEATETLKKGLMNQPLYTTGRVALGKVLMERSMFQEAREEFERVLDAMPENIVARKKLAEIYSGIGRPDLAREHEQVVSGLMPPPSKKETRAPDEGANPEAAELRPDSVIASPLGSGYAEDYPDDEKLNPGSLDLEMEPGPGSEAASGRASGEEGTPEAVIEIATESMADVYISQNLYDKAMEVLLKLEKQAPESKSVRQKIEDLRMLMNITNRGDESPG